MHECRIHFPQWKSRDTTCPSMPVYFLTVTVFQPCHLKTTPSPSLHSVFFVARCAWNSGWPFSSCLHSQSLRWYTRFSMSNFLIKIKVANVAINKSFSCSVSFSASKFFWNGLKTESEITFPIWLEEGPSRFWNYTVQENQKRISLGLQSLITRD